MAQGTNKNKSYIKGIDSYGNEVDLFLTSDGKMPVVISPPTDSIAIDFCYVNASISPVLANSYLTVLEYTVPTGYNLNLISFKSSSGNTAGFSRIAIRTDLGSYDAGTGVFTDGSSITSPRFSPTMEIQVTTAFSANETFTITYVNQDGIVGRTATVAIDSAAKRALGARMLVTLQSGDYGVRDVTNTTDGGAATGVISINGYNEYGYHRHSTANFVYDTQYASSQLLIEEAKKITFEIGATNTTSTDKLMKAIGALVVKL